MEEDKNFANKEEIEKTYTHHLCCSKCHLKLSIESKEKNNTDIGLRKMKCPACGKHLQLDTDYFFMSGAPSHSSQSKMNTMASGEAIKMANEMKRADAEAGRDKMIAVRSTQKGKNFGKTEMIPERIIKSIEEKVAPIIEES